MKIRVAVPLFLSALDYNYNAALRLYGPPAMFAEGSIPIIPALPFNVVTESNRETLVRLKHDLAWIGEQQLSAADAYRMCVCDELEQPFWGYCVESARADDSKEILVLMRSNEGRTRASTLRWVPMSKVYTRKHAHLRYKVVDTEGPAEDVVIEILQVLCEAFEYAVEDNWSYKKRLEFYHAFPFDELTTKEAVMAFRPVLFGCPAFANFEMKSPECE